MVTNMTKMNSPWFSKKNYYANVLAKLRKYQNLKALIYFLVESARHNKVVPSKTNSIHKLCVITSSKNLLLNTELCALKS